VLTYNHSLQPTTLNDNLNQFKVGLESDKGYFTLKVKTMTLMSHFFCPQSDLEPLRGSSNKKTLYSTRSCINWTFFWHAWAILKRAFHSRFKMAHACQKKPNLHTNSSNKLLFGYAGYVYAITKMNL
jgi:hypothetical protein